MRDARSDGGVVGADPAREELPLVLDSVFPCSWVVPIDYEIKGCPPGVEAIWLAVKHLAGTSKASTSG